MGTDRKELPVKTGVKSRVVRVEQLARVEGEGALYLKTSGNRVEDVQLKIFEPPRFFEAFLRGRKFTEAPDITARICGICPVAYQMSAVHAMERALGVAVPEPLRRLRRLLYCGEWIESHTLHVYLLHAPDFLGYADGIRMAKDHPRQVERGLQLKKAGNAIVALFGGREIHPINVRVGGFYRIPPREEWAGLIATLKRAREIAEETVAWVARFPFPKWTGGYDMVSLSHPTEYPFNEGRIVSTTGLDIDAAEFERHFEEIHVPYTNALHCVRKGSGTPYLVGPLARFALNREKLPPEVQRAARKAGVWDEPANPYRSIVVRALEVLFACEEAVRILETVEMPAAPAVEVPVRAAEGSAATEAPRGMLYHRYRVGEEGLIEEARIVPPTSQNQKTIEGDLRQAAEANLKLSDADLTWRCEQTIRNYDPCISCATHFLKVEIDRG